VKRACLVLRTRLLSAISRAPAPGRCRMPITFIKAATTHCGTFHRAQKSIYPVYHYSTPLTPPELRVPRAVPSFFPFTRHFSPHCRPYVLLRGSQTFAPPDIRSLTVVPPLNFIFRLSSILFTPVAGYM